MSFRVEQLVTAQDSVVLCVSGTIQTEYVETLKDALARETGAVAIDLRHVSLVDHDAVKLLAQCEANGIEIKNCRAYVRDWISRERSPTSAARSNPKSVVDDGRRCLIEFVTKIEGSESATEFPLNSVSWPASRVVFFQKPESFADDWLAEL